MSHSKGPSPLATIALLLPTLAFSAKTTTSSTSTTTTTTSTSNPCPASYTGRVATAGCKGYADCVNGKQTTTWPCTAGTLYDVSSGICNWPDSVKCGGSAPVFDDDDDYVDDDGKQKDETEEGDEIFSKFCPADYTGKAPTTDCLGYVVCTAGKEGLSTKCPTGSIFNSMTLRCEYGFDDCELLVSQDKINNLADFAQYCPVDYTGKAPTENCQGYVKCVRGQVDSALKCPTGTKFDVMKLACTYAEVACGKTDVPEEKDDMEQQSQQVDVSVYCPDEYTGRAPTAKCLGYVDCKNGKVKSEKACPSGTLFDVMILACTYSDVNCEATVPASFPPTPSPITEEQKKQRPERIVVDEDCPEDYTGNKAINGCKSYIYCQLGKRISKFDCTAGTVFDPHLGYCNWPQNVDTSVPECSTSSPSYTPTTSPINPTISPSFSPTPLDMEGELFYPDYKNGICKNDGKHPPSLSKIYLRSSANGCCSAFFIHTYDRCMQAFISEAPSIAPSGEKIWYPDYDFNLCRSDDSFGDYEVNFFASYEKCCQFDFLDEMECLIKKPSAMGLIYYPHYPSGMCKNDGRQSSEEIYLYTSREDCCHNDQVEYDSCMGKTTDEMNQNSSPVGSVYYPDYTHFTCRNDGHPPEFEINFFPTYDSCCQFSSMDIEKCRANKPVSDIDKWYPVVGSEYCVNDGNPPTGIALSNTSKDCCKRFFASSIIDCQYKSGMRWYPDFHTGYCKNDRNHSQGILMSETYELCCDRFMSANKTKCYSKSNVFLNSTAIKPTPQLTKTPTQKPLQLTDSNVVCFMLTKKNQCNLNDSCVWDDTTNVCNFASPTGKPSPPISFKPTIKLTERPLNTPTNIPTKSHSVDSTCGQLTTKKQCKLNDSCRWDDVTNVCSFASSTVKPSPLPSVKLTIRPTGRPTNKPTISPTKSPSVGSACGQLTKKKQCKLNDSCVWDDLTNMCSFASTVKPSPPPSVISTTRPTERPTNKPTNTQTNSPSVGSACGQLTTKKQCKLNDYCHWDDVTNVCSFASPTVKPSPPPSVKPTTRPTERPTNKPTKSPTNSPSVGPTCGQLTKKKQCKLNYSCVWDDVTNVCSFASPSVTPSPPLSVKPTIRPTERPTNRPTNTQTNSPSVGPSCGQLTKKKQCKLSGSCRWDDVTNVCSFASPTVKPSPPPSVKPTIRPTGRPTNRPTNIPTNTPSVGPTCGQLTKKKQCKLNGSCEWDDATNMCSFASSSAEISPPSSVRPTIKLTEWPMNQPAYSPTPDCEQFSAMRQCKQHDLCDWDDATNVCSLAFSTVETSVQIFDFKPTKLPSAALPNSTNSPYLRQNCRQLTKKELCTLNDWCKWNDASSVCSSAHPL